MAIGTDEDYLVIGEVEEEEERGFDGSTQILTDEDFNFKQPETIKFASTRQNL